MYKKVYYYSPKQETTKYRCIILDENIKKKNYTEINDGILEYTIKMKKIRYNKDEITYVKDVLPEEIIKIK